MTVPVLLVETTDGESDAHTTTGSPQALLSSTPDRRHHQHHQDHQDQGVLSNSNETSPTMALPAPAPPPRAVYRNFVLMTILFSIHHACVVSCLSLATARLGANVGATQSSILYVTYTGSALIGATYMVKRWGPHGALVTGMFLYCFYVAAFGVAATTTTTTSTTTAAVAYAGATLGGLGAGLVWTAQGSFFAQAAQAHARAAIADEGHHQPYPHYHDDNDEYIMETNQAEATAPSTATTTIHHPSPEQSSQSSARMAGIFAFFYLALELLLRSLSSSVSSWKTLFSTYGILTIVSTLGMAFVVQPPDLIPARDVHKERPSLSLLWYQVTAAIQMWKPSTTSSSSSNNNNEWPIMPYMLGLNAVFGLESAFYNAYINGQIVPAHQVGFWTAWASGVAAVWSLVLGHWTAAAPSSNNNNNIAPVGRTLAQHSNRKGWVLSAGAACFASVVLPFVVHPTIGNDTSSSSSSQQWTRAVLIFACMTLHGIGRSTFEGTLKSTFADFFAHEKEGAFANIILQNGLASSFGYFLTSRLHCSNVDNDDWLDSFYCVPYRDGSYHRVGEMGLLVIAVAILAVLGYWKAARMVHNQQEVERNAGMQGRNVDEDESSRRLV